MNKFFEYEKIYKVTYSLISNNGVTFTKDATDYWDSKCLSENLLNNCIHISDCVCVKIEIRETEPKPTAGAETATEICRN